MSTAVEATAAKGETEVEALRRMLARVQAEKQEAEAQLAKVKEQAISRYRFKVSDKGGITVLGMRSQFGLTLYINEFRTVWELQERIEEFYAEHQDEIDSRSEATLKAKRNGQ